jgi:CRISPR-associated protein Cas1
MKCHLNNLFVTVQGAWLAKDGQAVVVKADGDVKLRVPVHLLEGIVCFGNVTVSPFLMAHCAENNVRISFLTEYGRFLARVEGPTSGNVLLRRTQYRWADDPGQTTELARGFVAAKVANCRHVLQRGARDHPASASALRPAIGAMADALRRLDRVDEAEQIRGVEGEAARIYFSVFKHLFPGCGGEFLFTGRSRRPPKDPVNALLSFVYTLLLHDVRSALEGVGLDPQVGFLHRDRPGRPGLALDLMEELRPLMADRVVASLVNLRQVKPKGFRYQETGGVIMDEETRKVVLSVYQERKKQELVHPFLKEKCTIGAIPHIQAMLLARRLRGDLDAYPPFFWR